MASDAFTSYVWRCRSFELAPVERNTPLHSVARHCHPGALHAVELLVNARADMEATNEERRVGGMRRYEHVRARRAFTRQAKYILILCGSPQI